MSINPKLGTHVALVTGASRGIGASIALVLAEAGAAVAVNYRQKAAEAEAVAAQVLDRGGRAMAVGADVSQSAQVTAMIECVAGVLGPIDVLVNNAGIGITRGIDDLTEADFDQTIAVNLRSVFLCTQAVLPGMRHRRWGRVVNISSGAARGAGGIGPHAVRHRFAGDDRRIVRHAGEARFLHLVGGFDLRLRRRAAGAALPPVQEGLPYSGVDLGMIIYGESGGRSHGRLCAS